MSALPELVEKGFESLRNQLRADFKAEVAEQLDGVEQRLGEKYQKAQEQPVTNPNAERVAHMAEINAQGPEITDRQACQMMGGLIRAVGAAGPSAGEGKIKDTFKRMMGADSLKSLERLYEFEQAHATELARAGYEIGTPSQGGVFAPEVLMSRVIPMLYSAAVLGAIGIAPFQMGSNMLKWAKETAEGVAYWGRLEPSGIRASKGSLGEIRMEAKSLTAITSFTNTFLKATGNAANDIALRRFMRLFSKSIDLGALYGNGQQDAPLGLFSRTSGENAVLQFSKNAVPDAVMPMDILVALLKVDATVANLQWVMGPVVYGKLANLRDGNGNFYFPELRSKNPTLLGYPVRLSTVMKTSTTGPNYAADIMFGDWDRYLLGEYRPLELFSTKEGAYLDATGTMQSTVSNDETAVRFIWQGDMVPEDGNCFVAVTNVYTS
jgi:HK97 family phage major capsid protein